MVRNPQLNRHGELTHLLTRDRLPRHITTYILDTAETFLPQTEWEVNE